jgi:glycosyltransferase involved in cell wall biosynthesis
MNPSQELVPADVSIVVPVGGAAPAWRRSAQSLSRLDPPPGEIIVVIDGPDDGHAEAAAAMDAQVVVQPERGGPARARNRGAELAGGEILLFVDSDVEVPENLAADVAELFSDDVGLAAAIGSYDDDPGEPDFLSRYRNLLHHYVHQTGHDEASTFWAGCGAVRRRIFLEAGGFDERYAVPSIEDIELGSRLVRAGHRIRMAKDLQVKHLKRWRFADMLVTDLFRRAAPWTEQMLRDGEMVNDLNVKTSDRISVVAAFVAAAGLVGALVWPPSLVVCGVALAVAVVLNAGFFGFLLRRRGPLFAAAAIPMYWLYLLECGLGFALGAARHLTGARRRRSTRSADST